MQFNGALFPLRVVVRARAALSRGQDREGGDASANDRRFFHLLAAHITNAAHKPPDPYRAFRNSFSYRLSNECYLFSHPPVIVRAGVLKDGRRSGNYTRGGASHSILPEGGRARASVRRDCSAFAEFRMLGASVGI